MDGIAPYRPDTPKKKRKMIQPTKDYLRAELKLAEAEIERLQAELAELRQRSWWLRFWEKLAETPLPAGTNPSPPPGPKPPPPPCPPRATTLVRDGKVTKFR